MQHVTAAHQVHADLSLQEIPPADSIHMFKTSQEVTECVKHIYAQWMQYLQIRIIHDGVM